MWYICSTSILPASPRLGARMSLVPPPPSSRSHTGFRAATFGSIAVFSAVSCRVQKSEFRQKRQSPAIPSASRNPARIEPLPALVSPQNPEFRQKRQLRLAPHSPLPLPCRDWLRHSCREVLRSKPRIPAKTATPPSPSPLLYNLHDDVRRGASGPTAVERAARPDASARQRGSCATPSTRRSQSS